jgi:geranylgeranyl diphosphate synthase type II
MSENSLADLRERIERSLFEARARPSTGPSKRLNEALAYAMNTPGKRLRPLMVLAAALSCRGQSSASSAIAHALPAACAVEYVHTYSLIHDDLPCMDDDDYRRGRLSVHRRFDEALAILAGDALLADAFFLASSVKNNAALITRELALTAGTAGLVAGQAEDLASTTTTTLEEWRAINGAKTARLFQACAVIGGYAVGASMAERKALAQFGLNFGVSFQIKDDLDDESGLARIADENAVEAMLNSHLAQAQDALKDLAEKDALIDLLHLTFATAG